MKKLLLASVVLTAGLLAACHRDDSPPPPLPAEQIPTEFGKGFARAAPEAKTLSAQVTTALQAKDYPAAFDAVQSLCAAPGTTKAQQRLAVRAMLTITSLLQTAQAQGDQSAAVVLRTHQSSK